MIYKVEFQYVSHLPYIIIIIIIIIITLGLISQLAHGVKRDRIDGWDLLGHSKDFNA